MELLTLRGNLNQTLSELLPLTVYTAGMENQRSITRMKGFSAHQLFLTISGSGRFRRLGSEKDKWDILKSGNLLYIPAGCAHEYMPQDSEAWHVAYVTFLENFGNTLKGWGFRDIPRLFTVTDIPAITGRIRDIWTHSGGAPDLWHTSEALYALMLHILKSNQEQLPSASPVALPDSYRESAVDTAVQFLRDHLNRPITIASLAEHVGYSQKQLTRLFRSALDTTPLQYLHKLRLHTARQMLNEYPDLSIRQIAAYVGMEPVYFTRLYKRAYNELPSHKPDK